ncbi:MAG TPA: S-adenosylmethionine decarboxylase [Candidatus Eisenbacteria bacterium]|nr:S-adenosylmethionine decarboxylase [Candidatus Eisenbacteria bacterium]
MNGSPMVGFGPHLLYQAYGCPATRLDDLGRLYQLLEGMPDRIRMTRIMPPYVFRHASPGRRATGFSGFVLIAQSHISVHTFPSRRVVNADIFSCENFDVEDALSVLGDAFHPQKVEWHLLDRGREFPRDLAGSRALVEQHRRLVAAGLGLEVPR